MLCCWEQAQQKCWCSPEIVRSLVRKRPVGQSREVVDQKAAGRTLLCQDGQNSASLPWRLSWDHGSCFQWGGSTRPEFSKVQTPSQWHRQPSVKNDLIQLFTTGCSDNWHVGGECTDLLTLPRTVTHQEDVRGLRGACLRVHGAHDALVQQLSARPQHDAAPEPPIQVLPPHALSLQNRPGIRLRDTRGGAAADQCPVTRHDLGESQSPVLVCCNVFQEQTTHSLHKHAIPMEACTCCWFVPTRLKQPQTADVCAGDKTRTLCVQHTKPRMMGVDTNHIFGGDLGLLGHWCDALQQTFNSEQ